MNKINIKLKEIADSIKEYWIEHKSEIDPGLYSGTVGILIFFAYYARYSGEEEYQQIADEILEHCCEQISNGIFYAPFSGGLSGMLYALNHLNECGFINIDLTDVHQGYSDFLASHIKIFSENNKFDFMHEATGIAIYLLQYGNSSDLGNIADYVKSLNHSAEHVNYTVKWLSDVNAERKMIYNIALSHGMSSIAIFLAQCVEKNVEPYISTNLLTGVVQYILQQEIDPEKYGSSFASTSLEFEGPRRSRMGWCYGDLGVSMALWKAGITLNNTLWKSKAIEVMDFAADRRNLGLDNVVDAGLCHGTAGIAQIFRRMYYNTGSDKFLSGSKFWIDETLKMAKWGKEGAAGFKVWTEKPIDWINEYDFLKGIAGVGLALLASQKDKEYSAWDKILLLS